MFEFLKRQTPAGSNPEVKASASGRVVAFATQGRVAWSPRDTASLTRSGFTANPVGYRAVKLIAEAAAALPLTMQDRLRRYEIHPRRRIRKPLPPTCGRAMTTPCAVSRSRPRA